MVMRMTNTARQPTHTSYAAAVADLKAGKVVEAVWAAGEGFRSVGRFDSRTKRVVIALYNPDGSRCA
jgi:hypothetical protein